MYMHESLQLWQSEVLSSPNDVPKLIRNRPSDQRSGGYCPVRANTIFPKPQLGMVYGFSPQKMSWQVTHRQELWRSTLQLAQKALEEGRSTRSVFFWASNMSTDSGAGPPIGSLGISHLIIGVPKFDPHPYD